MGDHCCVASGFSYGFDAFGREALFIDIMHNLIFQATYVGQWMNLICTRLFNETTAYKHSLRDLQLVLYPIKVWTVLCRRKLKKNNSLGIKVTYMTFKSIAMERYSVDLLQNSCNQLCLAGM